MADTSRERKYTTEREIEQMDRELAEAEKTLSGGGTRSGKGKRSRAHKGRAGTIVFVVILACVALLLGKVWADKAAGRVPELFGYKIFQVETGSMEPTLPVGTVIVTRVPDDPENIPEGTIVTFRREDGTVVTHRIIEVLHENGVTLYRTKGDNPVNSADPDLLAPANIEAVYCFSLGGGNG